MKRLFSLLIILFLSPLLCAQAPAKAARQVAKNWSKIPAVSNGTRSAYSGTHGGLMGVDYYLLHNMPKTATNVSPRRSWLTQQQRDYKARQLKRQRRLRDAKALKLAQQAQELQAQRATLPPLLPEQALEATDFTTLRSTQLPTQPVPLLEEPGMLYRGMALAADGNALKNIFQNGLQLKDLGNHATTKLLTMSGGGRGAVTAVRPATNLTSFPQDALYWATQRQTVDKQLLVIVAVTGQTQSGKIVLYSDDIPADQIATILVPLDIEGVPTWCDVSLTQDGRFLIIPYQTNP